MTYKKIDGAIEAIKWECKPIKGWLGEYDIIHDGAHQILIFHGESMQRMSVPPNSETWIVLETDGRLYQFCNYSFTSMYRENSEEALAVVAWCPYCLTYGSPMSTKDRQCGNCGNNGCRMYEEIKLNIPNENQNPTSKSNRKGTSLVEETS